MLVMESGRAQVTLVPSSTVSNPGISMNREAEGPTTNHPYLKCSQLSIHGSHTDLSLAGSAHQNPPTFTALGTSWISRESMIPELRKNKGAVSGKAMSSANDLWVSVGSTAELWNKM